MRVATCEGFVEDGQIKLPAGVHLPEGTKVYVVVPDVDAMSFPEPGRACAPASTKEHRA
jgi:hypothetical protein